MSISNNIISTFRKMTESYRRKLIKDKLIQYFYFDRESAVSDSQTCITTGRIYDVDGTESGIVNFHETFGYNYYDSTVKVANIDLTTLGINTYNIFNRLVELKSSKINTESSNEMTDILGTIRNDAFEYPLSVDDFYNLFKKHVSIYRLIDTETMVDYGEIDSDKIELYITNRSFLEISFHDNLNSGSYIILINSCVNRNVNTGNYDTYVTPIIKNTYNYSLYVDSIIPEDNPSQLYMRISCNLSGNNYFRTHFIDKSQMFITVKMTGNGNSQYIILPNKIYQVRDMLYCTMPSNWAIEVSRSAELSIVVFDIENMSIKDDETIYDATDNALSPNRMAYDSEPYGDIPDKIVSGNNQDTELSFCRKMLAYYPQLWEKTVLSNIDRYITKTTIVRINKSDIRVIMVNGACEYVIKMKFPINYNTVMVFHKGRLVVPSKYIEEDGYNTLYVSLNGIYDDYANLGTKFNTAGFEGITIDELDIVTIYAPFDVCPIVKLEPFKIQADTTTGYYGYAIPRNSGIDISKAVLVSAVKEIYNTTDHETPNGVGEFIGQDFYRDPSGPYILVDGEYIVADVSSTAIRYSARYYIRDDNGQYIYNTNTERYEMDISNSDVQHYSIISDSYIKLTDDYNYNVYTTNCTNFSYSNGSLIKSGSASGTDMQYIRLLNNGEEVYGTLQNIYLYNTSFGYSKYNITDDEFNNYLAYIIPYQLAESKSKLLTFLDGRMYNDFSINANIHSQLFDGGNILTFNSDANDSNAIYSIYRDDNGLYIYSDINNLYMPVNDDEIEQSISRYSARQTDTSGTVIDGVLYIDVYDNEYNSHSDNSHYIKDGSGIYIYNAKTKEYIVDSDNIDSSVVPHYAYTEESDCSERTLPVLDFSITDALYRYDSANNAWYFSAPFRDYLKLSSRFSKTCRTMYMAGLGDFELYRTQCYTTVSDGVSTAHDVITFDNTSGIFTLTNTASDIKSWLAANDVILRSDYYTKPLSHKYMMFFVNGIYCDRDHLQIVGFNKFVLRNLDDFNFDRNSDDKIIINRIDIFVLSKADFSQYKDIMYKTSDTSANKVYIFDTDNDTNMTDYYNNQTALTTILTNNSGSNPEKDIVLQHYSPSTDYTASKFEIFGKFILNKYDLDNMPDSLWADISDYFSELIDVDGRFDLELYQDNTRRRFIY